MATTFRPPTRSDIETVGRNMRAIDALECAEIAGQFPMEALEDGVRDSVVSRAALVDGKPVCIFGVAPEQTLGAVGTPWLLGVEGFEAHSRQILRHSRAYVRAMLDLYPHLRNLVHSDNGHAIRWLKWCGFEIGEEQPLGRSGAMFRPFELKAS